MYIYGYHILFYASVAAVLGVGVFALWKGDAPVRFATGAMLAVEAATALVNPKFGDVGSESALLALDFAFAVILLILAVRFASLWIGAAMLLQAAQFSLHAYYLVMELPQDRLHAWINNINDWGILVCICLGTILAIRRRAAHAREEAEREARRVQRGSPAA
jgi:hypothetical protein